MCCVVHRTAGVSVGRGVSEHVMLGLLGGAARAGVGVRWGSQNYFAGWLARVLARKVLECIIPEMPWWG